LDLAALCYELGRALSYREVTRWRGVVDIGDELANLVLLPVRKRLTGKFIRDTRRLVDGMRSGRLSGLTQANKSRACRSRKSRG
jgi:hypothetical protein